MGIGQVEGDARAKAVDNRKALVLYAFLNQLGKMSYISAVSARNISRAIHDCRGQWVYWLFHVTERGALGGHPQTAGG